MARTTTARFHLAAADDSNGDSPPQREPLAFAEPQCDALVCASLWLLGALRAAGAAQCPVVVWGGIQEAG